MKPLKLFLHALNIMPYGDIPNRTKEAYDAMCKCQEEALATPYPVSFTVVADASNH